MIFKGWLMLTTDRGGKPICRSRTIPPFPRLVSVGGPSGQVYAYRRAIKGAK